MRGRDEACVEVLAVARGDERDAAGVRAHLQACPPCARETAAMRALVELTRRSLEADAALVLERFPLRPIDAVLRGTPAPDPLRGLALAASAAFVLVGLTALLAAREAPAARALAPLADASRSFVMEVGSPDQERLPFVLRTPAGVREGDLDLGPQDVLETVPANLVVVDTF